MFDVLKYILPGYSLSGTIVWAAILAYLYALYSGCEIGLYRVNRLRLHLSYRRRDKRAIMLNELLDKPQVLISVFVLGANICGYLIATSITVYMTGRGFSAGETELWTAIILTPVFTVFCETLPKNCFYAQANQLMLRSANFIRISYLLARITGLFFLLKGFPRLILRIAHYFGPTSAVQSDWDDMGILLKESLAAGPFSEIQGGIAERLLQLPEIPLSKVIIPLSRTVAFPMEISRRDFMDQIKKTVHSRFPLYEGSAKNIVGMVNIYQALTDNTDRPPLDYLRPIPKISSDQKLLDTLNILRENSVRLAVVTDRSGGAVGIVTITDLLNEIFGKLD